jgi:hypothetical protein
MRTSSESFTVIFAGRRERPLSAPRDEPGCIMTNVRCPPNATSARTPTHEREVPDVVGPGEASYPLGLLAGAVRPTTHERSEAARALDRIGGLVQLPAPDPRSVGILFLIPARRPISLVQHGRA